MIYVSSRCAPFTCIRCSSTRSPNGCARPLRPRANWWYSRRTVCPRALEAGDSYADEVAATARAVASRTGIARYEVVYQSAGRTPEPWIGPELCALVRERAAAGGRRFLIAPIGFVCDHTEILFDIDVQAAAAAREHGAALRRTESLNTSPTFIAMLEGLVRRML